ncbi:molybdate ABC transporter substrate-binding protein [Arenibacterium sp. CAU 1754]
MTSPGFRRFLQPLVLCLALFGSAVDAQPTVTVFAAASLKTALDDVADRYLADSPNQVQISYGGSSALARQIQYGAPAQVFISANAAWMDTLEADGALVDDTRVNLLTNRLVLIAAPGTDTTLRLSAHPDLAAALGQDGRLAMALVDAVPAGIYGRAALEFLGLWEDVRTRIAQSDNVRATLRLVAMGEAPLGIVYATDALADPRVHVIDSFAPETHPPIRYPAAILRDGDTAETRDFFDFLTGPAAAGIFRAHGFGVIGAGE